MAVSTFTISGISRLQAILTPKKMGPALDRNMRKATGQNALFVLKEIRKGIRAGAFEGNATLTEAVKGSAKPLVDKGDVFGALTKQVIDPRTAFVGLLRTDNAFNIGVTIHEGMEIKVTNKMRGLFFILWLASQGGIPAGDLKGRAAELFDRYQDWKPLSPSTTVIRVPARKFISDVFDKPVVRRRTVVNWANAVRQTIREAK